MSFAHFTGLLEPGPWVFGLGVMLFALPLLVAAGAAGLSFFLAVSGRVGGKVFADKLSKQLAKFGMIVLGAWLLLVSARWGVWAASWWPVGEVGQIFYPLFFDIPGHLALLATLTSIALVQLWRKSRRTSGAHLALGAVSSVLWPAILAAFVAGAFWRLHNDAPGMKLSMAGFAAAVMDPLAWLVWGQLVFSALTAGAGFGLLYLLYRRNKEDYGRDYYSWSVKHCAWWAVLAGVVQAGWVKAVFWHEALARPDRADLAGANWISDTAQAFASHGATPALIVSLSLALLAWLSLVPVLRTQAPLRMRGWMLLHAGLVVLSVVTVCRMYSDLF